MPDLMGRLSVSDIPAEATYAGDWLEGDLDYNGVDVVDGVTPAAGVYLLTNGFVARNVTIRSNIRVRHPNIISFCDHFIMEDDAWFDCDGNPASGVTAGSITSPALQSATADTGAGIGAGTDNGRTTTGVGAVGGGSGGGGMGSCSGQAGAAGTQAAGATTAGTNLIDRYEKHFRTRRFLATSRVLANTSLVQVHSGQGGTAGSLDLTAGTGTSGGPGTGGATMILHANRVTMGARARWSGRGGNGGNAACAGGGIGGGGTAGGGGWMHADIGESFDADPTATVDCDSGEPGLGSGGGLDATYGPAGTVVFWIKGQPAPRQRVMFCGESLTIGSPTPGDAIGGMRSFMMRGRRWNALPWLPVGNDKSGAFGDNLMCGIAGLNVATLASRVLLQAPQHLLHRDGWPDPVVPILVGSGNTNGIGGAFNGPVAVAQYSALLDSIWAVNPRALVIAALVPDNGGNHANVVTLNGLLAAMYAARPEYHLRLWVADLYTALGLYATSSYWADATGHLTVYGSQRATTDGWIPALTAAGV